MKRPVKKLFPALLSILLLVLCTGCSVSKSPEAKAGVRFTVLTVVDNYLRAIASGNGRATEQMIIWSHYSENSKSGETRTSLIEGIDTLKGRWLTKTENPLLGLDVVSFNIDENEAEITLVKPPSQRKTDRQISIDLVWAGNSWLVSKDNIFGKAGYLADF